LHTPVDHRQEDAAEDEGEHGRELWAEAEAPHGEPEEHGRGRIERLPLRESFEGHDWNVRKI
jgi:hypothetical protein